MQHSAALSLTLASRRQLSSADALMMRDAIPFDDAAIVEPEPIRVGWSAAFDASVIVASVLLMAATCGLIGFYLGRASVFAGSVL